MKIGFISNFEIDDKRAWSGTINFLYETLNEEYDIYPIIIKPNFIHRILRKIVKFVTRKGRTYTAIDQMFYRVQINKKIKKAISSDVDVFFAPAASTILGIASIPERCKVIYLSDTTYHCMINYYYFNQDVNDMNRYNSLEYNSLHRADYVIFSSEWAKNDAVDYYKVDKNKIYVLPFGANLEDRYIEHDLHNIIKVLFVGVEWERKGTELAIKCIEYLNEVQKKWKFELTIIGLDKPEKYNVGKEIKFLGRLNKDNLVEYNQMIKCYQESDIFLLPTKAECAGIVFSEAAMYGLPSFTHSTGGVMTYVEDRETGRGLKIGATPEKFAKEILDMLNDNKYKEWSRNSRQKYEEELNWDCWLARCKELIQK